MIDRVRVLVEAILSSDEDYHYKMAYLKGMEAVLTSMSSNLDDCRFSVVSAKLEA